MVVRIEVSDDRGEHFELIEDGSIKLFGTTADAENGVVIVSERQGAVLRAAIMAQADILKVHR